jgi:transcription antitermination factor NusG
MSTESQPIVAVPGERWTAVHTKPRCEKVVDTYCRRNQIPCYLPLLRRAKRYQRRTVETFLPMFPGYIFVRLGADQLTTLLRSHKVVRVLRTDEVTERVLIDELHQIQQLEAMQQEAELVVQPDLAPGNAVTITSGPLAGLSGIVERRRNKTRVTVNVELLGQSVSADLDIGEVDRSQ